MNTRFHMEVLVTSLLVLSSSWATEAGGGGRGCERGPGEGVVGPPARAEGKFKLFIHGEPQFYNPGEMYTVTLKSLGPKFVWFSLWAEGGNGENPGSLTPYGDWTTSKSGSCPALVTAASTLPKTEASSLWSAPLAGCVTFKARVVVEREVWYTEEGPLSYTICENMSGSSDEQQSQVNQECCACDEAKYEVGFEGLWSRQTHPKDFPDKNITRFSDVIGASHTTQYRFWDYGGIASEGLREVAELGSTRTLESELKSQSQHIRTIIKARGIAFPNVTSKTFAVFRVDNKHHLISLVSMIAPSPDWIVGVSGLELCLTNCTWIESKVVNLYPWDAGTDSGLTYLSPKNRTEPKDHIRRITSSFPADPRSPFFDPTGEPMKPLAKLYLTRQRLYEKVCENNAPTETLEACQTKEWGEWSGCSVSCGLGTRTRQRFYVSERRAQEAGCQEELTSRIACHQPQPCRWEEADEDGPWALEKRCNFSQWSPWSNCSAICGAGHKYRFRRLLDREKWKECLAGRQRPPTLSQSQPCQAPHLCTKQEQSNCSVLSEWSEWTGCSVSCGPGGRRQRQRQTSCRLLTQDMPCLDSPDCRLTPQLAREICLLGKPEDGCRGNFAKYFFDSETLSCTKFVSGGCPLSRNQFDTEEDCQINCGFLKEELANASEGANNLLTGFNNLDSPGGNGLNSEMQPAPYLWTFGPVMGVEGPVVDCSTSEWTDWGPCSVSCGLGFRKKMRHILTNARNGGKACPRKLLKTKRCQAGPCPGSLVAEESFLMGLNAEMNAYRRGECAYSEWSSWSPCSPPCGGLTSVQERTRRASPPSSSSSGLLHCPDRRETRVCNVLPCTS